MVTLIMAEDEVLSAVIAGIPKVASRMLTAMRRASSRVSRLAAARRLLCGSDTGRGHVLLGSVAYCWQSCWNYSMEAVAPFDGAAAA